MLVVPLSNPSIGVKPPGKFERICIFVPILGWIVAASLGTRRRTPRADAIALQIAARAESVIKAWGEDAARHQVVEVVCDAIMNEFGWPNDRYVPEDPLELLLWSTGPTGGEPFCCFIDIEQRLQRRIIDREFSVEWTLGEFVDHLAKLPRKVKK